MSDLLSQTRVSDFRFGASLAQPSLTPSARRLSSYRHKGARRPQDRGCVAGPALAGAADGHPRRLGRERCSSRHGWGPGSVGRPARVDHHGVLARLRQPAAARRPRRRPAGSAPDVPSGPRRVHSRLAGLRAGWQRRRVLRRARWARGRCRDALPGRAVDRHDDLPRTATHKGTRCLGRGRRRRRSRRRPARRHADRAGRLARDLLHQPAHQRRRLHRRPPHDPRGPQPSALGGARPARRAAGDHESGRHRLRAVAGRRRRLDLGADAWPRPRRAGRAGGVRRAGDANAHSAAERLAPARAWRRRRFRDDAHRLIGSVRHLPADLDVSAERARHRPDGDRPGVPAHRDQHRTWGARREPPDRPRRAAPRDGTGVHPCVGGNDAPVAPGRQRQLRRRRAARHRYRRIRTRHRPGRRRPFGSHRGCRRGGGHAVGLEHHRTRSRWGHRHRRHGQHRHRLGHCDAFLVASIIAAVGAIVGALLLPTTRTFLPKLKAAPPVAVH